MEDAELIKNKLINGSLAYILTIHVYTQNIPQDGLRKILIHKSLGKKRLKLFP